MADQRQNPELLRTPEPALILGVDARPWGSRAVLARAFPSEGVGVADTAGAGEVIDTFEVGPYPSLWERVSDLVTRAEDVYGRSPLSVRVASLPGRSHPYEVDKLHRYLPAGSSVRVVPVAKEYARRPRLQDPAEIRAKSDQVSLLLAIGVAQLAEPGDTIEIGQDQLAELATPDWSSRPKMSVVHASDDGAVPVDEQSFATADGTSGADATGLVDGSPTSDSVDSQNSRPFLVAAVAAVLVLLGATGILGIRSNREPVSDAPTTTVVASTSTSTTSTTTTSTSTTSTSTTSTSTTSTTTTSTTTTSISTSTVAPEVEPANPVIDFSGVEFNSTAPEAAPPTTDAPFDLSFLPETNDAPDLGFLPPPPAESGPIDLSSVLPPEGSDGP